MPSVDLIHPATPPSFNSVGYSGNRWTLTKAVAGWKDDLMILLMAAKMPKGLERIDASAVLTFPDRRRRDTGNFRTILDKALGDALQLYGAISDDDSEHYDFGSVRFEHGPRETRITLTYEEVPVEPET